jgi:hypothetical protein
MPGSKILVGILEKIKNLFYLSSDSFVGGKKEKIRINPGISFMEIARTHTRIIHQP